MLGVTQCLLEFRLCGDHHGDACKLKRRFACRNLWMFCCTRLHACRQHMLVADSALLLSLLCCRFAPQKQSKQRRKRMHC
jgi:hypothetical protein